jgi:hypothetical protein
MGRIVLPDTKVSEENIVIFEYWKQCKIEQINLDNRGRIGHNAKIVFMMGHCHSLAYVINSLTGWQICSFVCKEYDDRINSPSHIVIKTPKKDYLDIEGLGALPRWKETRPNTRVYKIDKSIIEKGLDCFLPLQIEKTIPFAKMLLKQQGLQYVRTISR